MLRLDQHVAVPTLNDADYVHDVAYDYYGTRMALCTSSLKIMVFSAPRSGAEGGQWTETAKMDRAHSGPIWRLCWGGPEHGEPLASCSEDRTVQLWSDRGQRSGGASANTWPKVGTLQCEGPVVGVRFSPASIGLKVAACTVSGRSRIFECASSSLESAASTWEQEDLEPRASPPESGGPAQLGAALDWMPAPFGGGAAEDREALALAGAGRLTIWVRRGGRWTDVATTEVASLGDVDGGVKDVAWCPNLCRPYELVCTCGNGAALWRVELSLRDDRGERGGGYGRKDLGPPCHLQKLKELVPPGAELCPVWRCSWNLTGTTLALCPEGGEGAVSVWKADALIDDWRQEVEIDSVGVAEGS